MGGFLGRRPIRLAAVACVVLVAGALFAILSGDAGGAGRRCGRRLTPRTVEPWACWNGRPGDIPRIPGVELALHAGEHLERLPRLSAWAKLKLAGSIYPLQSAPAAPLTQDGQACKATRAGPTQDQTNPQG